MSGDPQATRGGWWAGSHTRTTTARLRACGRGRAQGVRSGRAVRLTEPSLRRPVRRRGRLARLMQALSMTAETLDVFVMLYDWKRVIEVMKQRTPGLVLRRASEPLGVILEPAPLHE